jgi:hypothetical protein
MVTKMPRRRLPGTVSTLSRNGALAQLGERLAEDHVVVSRRQMQGSAPKRRTFHRPGCGLLKNRPHWTSYPTPGSRGGKRWPPGTSPASAASRSAQGRNKGDRRGEAPENRYPSGFPRFDKRFPKPRAHVRFMPGASRFVCGYSCVEQAVLRQRRTGESMTRGTTKHSPGIDAGEALLVLRRCGFAPGQPESQKDSREH